MQKQAVLCIEHVPIIQCAIVHCMHLSCLLAFYSYHPYVKLFIFWQFYSLLTLKHLSAKPPAHTAYNAHDIVHASQCNRTPWSALTAT